MPDHERDLARIALQEQRLVFPRFDAATAWDIGCRLKAAAEARGAALVIDIQVAGRTLFHHAMPGTTPDNADWVRRKRNVVQRFHRSSYAMGLMLQQQGTTLEAKYAADPKDHASHGGGFPLRVEGTGCVGSITVSGIPQREDHGLVVRAIAEHLGLDPAGLALD